jgi:hypothetical protein
MGKVLTRGHSLKYPPYALIHYIRQSSPSTDLLSVSDGSMKESEITFGWVFGTTEGTILASHSGIGSGAATSHRAEAWGMLSVAIFLHHLCIYTRTTDWNCPKRKVMFLCDNNGLVSRVT